MPVWLIKTLIVLVFGPPMVAGIALLTLGGTYMQVMDKREEEANEHPKHYRRRRTV